MYNNLRWSLVRYFLMRPNPKNSKLAALQGAVMWVWGKGHITIKIDAQALCVSYHIRANGDRGGVSYGVIVRPEFEYFCYFLFSLSL